MIIIHQREWIIQILRTIKRIGVTDSKQNRLEYNQMRQKGVRFTDSRKIDTTLLDSDKPLSMEDIRRFYRKQDFTCKPVSHTPDADNPGEKHVYNRAKAIFRQAFLRNTTDLNGKNKRSSYRNFSKDAPITVLEKTDEDYIIAEVMKAAQNEELLDQATEIFTGVYSWKMLEEYAAYCDEHHIGIDDIDDLPDDVCNDIMEKTINCAVDDAMKALLSVQQVPTIVSMAIANPAAEDFSTAPRNFDKTNFVIKWYKAKRNPDGNLEFPDVVSFNEKLSPVPDYFHVESYVAAVDLFERFVDSLSPEDRAIFRLDFAGYTQKEIADILHYKTHSAIGKRLKKIGHITDKFVNLIKVE